MKDCSIDKGSNNIDISIGRKSDVSSFRNRKVLLECVDSLSDGYDVTFIDRLLSKFVDSLIEQIKCEHEELRKMNYKDMENLFKSTGIEKWSDINILVKKFRSFDNARHTWNDFLNGEYIDKTKLKNVLEFIEIFLQHKILEINHVFSGRINANSEELKSSVHDNQLSTLVIMMKESILLIEKLKDTYIHNS